MNKEERLYYFKMVLGLVEFDEAANEAISELPIAELLRFEEYKKMAQRCQMK